ncbi:MAG: ribulose-phosphate 3-epimerase [Flavobacteriaceae bacterium]|nr:ribulose-phosphate 3-epimerase [Flavobacteriaceae bacterium]|tara:strand:+ start:35255 stop:35911 length:657 start_codon:yes stop_codon:yes gene_type:complete
MGNHLIAPSILSADFSNLKTDIEMINSSQADWFHVDIMDGVFVPNISFGMPVLKAISKYAKKELDVHLMIINPEKYIEKFAELGSDNITIHYETCNNLDDTIKIIKHTGVKVGVAINPDTDVKVLAKYINKIDMVCLMGVFPGFSGQKFIEKTFQRCSELRQMIISNNSKCQIEIDGGVSDTNARKLLECGANILVAGSFVFKSENPQKTISTLKNII